MNTLLNKITWLENWELKKECNVEIGFDNHTMLRGYMACNTFPSFEQLPNIDFFLKIKKLKPKRYDDNVIVYGEIVCYVNDELYKVIYHYDKNCYMITDKADSIIKKVESDISEDL